MKKKKIFAYELSGYVCLFCKSCNAVGSICTDNSIYHISRNDVVVSKLLSTHNSVPLVIHHFADAVVGYISKFELDDKGIYVSGAVLDNLEFLKYVTSVYEDTYSSILQNKQVNLEATLKKQLTGFSLSHVLETGDVAHVGLVAEPARIGTLVSYKKSNTYIPKSYGNIDRVINRMTGQTWVFQDHKHKKYLINNLSESKDITDCTFLNASMKPDVQKVLEDYIPELIKLMNNKISHNDEEEEEEEETSEPQNKIQKTEPEPSVSSIIEQPSVSSIVEPPKPVEEPVIEPPVLKPEQPIAEQSVAQPTNQDYFNDMDSKLKGLIDVVTKEKEHNKNAINAMNNLILENQNKDSNYKLLYSMYDTLSKQNSQIQQHLNSLTSGTKPAPAMVNASIIPTRLWDISSYRGVGWKRKYIFIHFLQ